MWDKPKVLFLCAGHPERSEMAEGFLRALAKDALQPVSAAVEPAPLDPLAVDAMNEVGIDISRQVAKNVRTALQEPFAYVVGLGDESKEDCPVSPFALRSFQWSLEDPLTVQGPTEQRLEAFRRVRWAQSPRTRGSGLPRTNRGASLDALSGQVRPFVGRGLSMWPRKKSPVLVARQGTGR